jgi:predicted RNA-binding Zn-ribbon protein involved in translation (DUF1610 family)
MSISVTCTDCGKRLKAPDSLAGLKARCPDCGAIVPVPDASAASNRRDDDSADAVGDTDAVQSDDGEAARKPCPMCGELIVATAVKCRFCGEYLDRLGKRSRRVTDHDEEELTVFDILLCILCAKIGCIIGILALIRGQSSRGAKMIGLSLLSLLALGALIELARQGR